MNYSEKVKRISVRINADGSIGSGVIYSNRHIGNYIYVFTAKHCIFGKKFSKEIDVKKIFIQTKNELDEGFNSYPILDFIATNNEQDLAIIICERHYFFDDEDEIVELNFLVENQSIPDNILIVGYPKANFHLEAIAFEVVRSDKINSRNRFSIRSLIGLSSFNSSSEDNSEGLSGSGVFFTLNNSIFLAGIVTDIKPYDSFECIGIKPNIDFLLTSKGFPELFGEKAPQKATKKGSQFQNDSQTISMEHYLDIELRDLQRLRENLFPSIAQGNAILVIGPGLLTGDDTINLYDQLIEGFSKIIGLEGYKPELLTEFVDTLKQHEKFSYSEFERFLDNYYALLKPQSAHKVISQIRWKEIITINPDILLEKAFDDPISGQILVPIYDKKSYRKMLISNEVKYVKIFGSTNDLGLYPFVVSSSDWKNQDGFIKSIADSLSNLSNRIPLIFCGFSDIEKNSMAFIEKLNQFAFQSDWIYFLDPHIRDIRLPYYSGKKVCIIKSTTNKFFELYSKWEEDGYAMQVKRHRFSYEKKNSRPVALTAKITNSLGNNIVQLNNQYNYKTTKAKAYYEGQEPSFDIINNNVDVIKKVKLMEVKNKVSSKFESNDIVPIILLTGSYGTGKTTFSYRLIHELVSDDPLDCLAFEVLDTERVNIGALNELFISAQCKNYIIYVNAIEVDSSFKSLFAFQKRLSIDNPVDYNIILLSSIRGNILQKFNKEGRYGDLFQEIEVDTPFNMEEAYDLITKIENQNLVQVKDLSTRNYLANKVFTDYRGDSLISLYNIIPNSSHDKFIKNAYDELGEKTKSALIFTSLLHRFNLKMPAPLLHDLLGMTWNDMIENVIKADGKNILLQDSPPNHLSTEPDLYFITKHSTIANAIVEMVLKNRDKRYNKYLTIFEHLRFNDSHAVMAVNLLKALEHENKDLPDAKIEKLYDRGGKTFDDSPHYILHYAINLQRRNTEESLLKAVDVLMYVQRNDNLSRPNHFLIHRRGSVSFSLAKHYLSKGQIGKAESYAHEARDFFERKKAYDPDSQFSYSDLIKLEIWYLEKLISDKREDKMDRAVQQVVIEQLLDEAKSTVFGKENVERIVDVEDEYRNRFNAKFSDNYLNSLIKKIESNDNTKPFLLIRLLHYYNKKKLSAHAHQVIEQLEDFTEIDLVVKELFKYYGRHLYVTNMRIKLYSLLRQNSELQEKDFLRYNYYYYVASAYDKHFNEAFGALDNIKDRFSFKKLNPFISEVWRENDGSERVFDGVVKLKRGWGKQVKVFDLDNIFPIIKNNLIECKVGDKVSIKLHFYVFGIKVQIISVNDALALTPD